MFRLILLLFAAWAAAFPPVVAALTIVAGPVENTVVSGNSVSLHVEVSGTGPVSHQWRKLGAPIAGATSDTLTLDAVELVDAGFYDVVVSDGLESKVSEAMRVRVIPPYYPNGLRPDASFAPRFERRGGLIASVVAAPDGTFYASGAFSRIDGIEAANIARFHANGSLDASFAPPRLTNNSVDKILLQPDGKLIALVSHAPAGVLPRHRLVRVNADGSMDETFVFNPGSEGEITAVALQPDGRILFAGARMLDAVPADYVAVKRHMTRLLPDGSLDVSFVPGKSVGTVIALAVDDGGRILVTDRDSSPGVARLNSDGSVDASFAAEPGAIGPLSDSCLLPDGKIIVAARAPGFISPGQTPSSHIIRLNPDGLPDSTFDSGSALAGRVRTLVAQADGRILVGWNEAPWVTRLLPDGSPDDSFSAGDVELFGPNLTVLADARILVGGTRVPTSGQRDHPLIGLEADGGTGAFANPSFRGPAAVYAVLPEHGGGWIVAGAFDFVNDSPAPNIARLTTGGDVAPGFPAGSGFDGAVQDMARQGDGKILCTGAFTQCDGIAVNGVARLERDGSRDGTFSPTLPDDLRADAQLAIQPDGRILASVRSLAPGTAQTSFSRWNMDGSDDPSYAPETQSIRHWARATLVNRDGSAFVTGTATSYGEPGSTLRILKLNSDGSIDSDFALHGDWGGAVSTMDLQADGKLVAGGGVTLGGIVRANSDGSEDLSFDVGDGFDRPVDNLKVQANGDILVLGNFDSFDGHARPSLARLNSDGSLDEDFEILGISTEGQIASATYTAGSGLLLAGNWMSFGDFPGRGLVLLEPVPEPVIKSGPVQPPVAKAGGAGITLSAEAVGNGVVTHQWQAQYNDGDFVDIPGANSATLAIPSPQRFHTGNYRVVVSSNGISVASTPAPVTVAAAAPSPDARLLNLSTRAQVETGDRALISGFVIAGGANKRLLIRAAGPTLNKPPIDLGGDVLPDPSMTLKKFNPALPPHGGFEDYASNDNWATNANATDIESLSAQLGAFALTHANDAALLIDLAPGRYTAVTEGAAAGSGVAIAELYDTDAADGGSRLVNISSRGFAGVGGEVMIPGFVVSNEGPRTLLIRAVGPTLANPEFGVQGAMADPMLIVHRANGDGSSSKILSQDNWGENPDAAYTAQIAREVGAFELAVDSADAAFVVTLPPGVYTIHGRSADGMGTGVVLMEVYDIVSP